MKKRYIFRTSLGSLILQFFVLLMLVFDIFACIMTTSKVVKSCNSNNGFAIFVMIIFYLGIPIICYMESTFLFGLICLDKDCIFTKGDKRIRWEKIQFPASVKYKDINSISIIAYRGLSNGNSSSLPRPIPYLFIKNKRGDTIRFALYFMSEKAVKRLLVGLKESCSFYDNVITIDVDSLIKDFKKSRIAV